MLNARTPPYHVIVRVQNNRLLQLRKEAGLTQDDLATQLGFSQSTYGNIENLRTFPHYANGEWRSIAIELAAYWGKRIDWLFPASVVEGQVNRLIAEMTPKALDQAVRHLEALSSTRSRAA